MDNSRLINNLFELGLIGLGGIICAYAKQIAQSVAEIKTQNAVMLERLENVSDAVEDHEARLRRVEYPHPN